MELVTPHDIEQLIPWIRVDDLEGGILIPGDGSTNPTDTCMALAKGAKDNGMVLSSIDTFIHVYSILHIEWA